MCGSNGCSVSGSTYVPRCCRYCRYPSLHHCIGIPSIPHITSRVPAIQNANPNEFTNKRARVVLNAVFWVPTILLSLDWLVDRRSTRSRLPTPSVRRPSYIIVISYRRPHSAVRTGFRTTSNQNGSAIVHRESVASSNYTHTVV